MALPNVSYECLLNAQKQTHHVSALTTLQFVIDENFSHKRFGKDIKIDLSGQYQRSPSAYEPVLNSHHQKFGVKQTKLY